MKKFITILVLILLGFTTSTPKLLKVEANINTWNSIVNVIDLSVADPKERVAARNFILNQLAAQMKDTTKGK